MTSSAQEQEIASHSEGPVDGSRRRVAEFAPGRNQLNQDVYVLERV